VTPRRFDKTSGTRRARRQAPKKEKREKRKVKSEKRKEKSE
jgi:hypothetical protein